MQNALKVHLACSNNEESDLSTTYYICLEQFIYLFICLMLDCGYYS